VPKIDSTDETFHLPDPKTGLYSFFYSRVNASTVLELIPTVTVSQLLHDISSSYRDGNDLLSTIYNSTYSSLRHNNHNTMRLSTLLTMANLTQLLPVFHRKNISLDDLHHLEASFLRHHIGITPHDLQTLKTALSEVVVNRRGDSDDYEFNRKKRYFQRIVIDILLIDTEGHDALVIRGAKYLLMKKAIR
jgi:hypothetical protein